MLGTSIPLLIIISIRILLFIGQLPRSHPWAMPLAMIPREKQLTGFWVWGWAWWSCGPPEVCHKIMLNVPRYEEKYIYSLKSKEWVTLKFDWSGTHHHNRGYFLTFITCKKSGQEIKVLKKLRSECQRDTLCCLLKRPVSFSMHIILDKINYYLRKII